jgi:AraC family transcriptional regulator
MAKHFDPVTLGSPRFRTTEHGGFLVSAAWFPPHQILPAHVHERTVVAITLRGGWDSVLDRRPRVSAVGMVLTEPAGERHANHFDDGGAQVLAIQPDSKRVEAFEPWGGLLNRVNHFQSSDALSLARRLTSEIRFPDAALPLAVESLSLEILMAAARRRGSHRGGTAPLWLRRVADYLHDSFLDRPSMVDLTSIAAVHPGHLAREFRRHFHVPIVTYLRRLRLDWAAERLTMTCLSIAEIAIAAGFADQSHFTRAFRRHTGRSPQEFRQADR